MKFGLQVYTIRDVIDDNFEAAFEEVKKTGCKNIELPGLFGRDADELRSFFDSIDMSVAGVMFPLEELTVIVNFDEVLSNCKTLGSSYVVCPWLVEEYRTHDGYSKAAQILDKAAKKLNSNGITLAYHNHAFEFETLESGKCGYDILVSETEFLTFELDVFWAKYAGLNPIVKMEELDDRLSLIHLKDMDNEKDKQFCELGYGVVELAPIIQAADNRDIPFAFLEQDSNWINGDPIESIQKSFKWLDHLKSVNF